MTERLGSITKPRQMLLAALAALVAVGMGLSAAHAATPPGPPDAPGSTEPVAITTVLYPGWNMVGWVGPSTPTPELFDAIPPLRQVSAWDAEEQAYRHALRNRYDDLATLTPGVGLWLRLGGDSTIEWTRLVSDGRAVVWLGRGDNVVAVPADGAVNLPGSVATKAWRWDPAIQRFASYQFGEAVLSRGDALWIEMSSPLTWLQSDDPDPPIVFVGDIPAETRASILAERERVQTFFVDRFAIFGTGPQHYIGADLDAFRAADPAVPAWPGVCASGRDRRIFAAVLRCAYPNHAFYLSNSYRDYLLSYLPNGGGRWRVPVPTGPDWLRYGTDSYAYDAYFEERVRADSVGSQCEARRPQDGAPVEGVRDSQSSERRAQNTSGERALVPRG